MCPPAARRLGTREEDALAQAPPATLPLPVKEAPTLYIDIPSLLRRALQGGNGTSAGGATNATVISFTIRITIPNASAFGGEDATAQAASSLTGGREATPFIPGDFLSLALQTLPVLDILGGPTGAFAQALAASTGLSASTAITGAEVAGATVAVASARARAVPTTTTTGSDSTAIIAGAAGGAGAALLIAACFAVYLYCKRQAREDAMKKITYEAVAAVLSSSGRGTGAGGAGGTSGGSRWEENPSYTRGHYGPAPTPRLPTPSQRVVRADSRGPNGLAPAWRAAVPSSQVVFLSNGLLAVPGDDIPHPEVSVESALKRIPGLPPPPGMRYKAGLQQPGRDSRSSRGDDAAQAGAGTGGKGYLSAMSTRFLGASAEEAARRELERTGKLAYSVEDGKRAVHSYEPSGTAGVVPPAGELPASSTASTWAASFLAGASKKKPISSAAGPSVPVNYYAFSPGSGDGATSTAGVLDMSNPMMQQGARGAEVVAASKRRASVRNLVPAGTK